jgi:hypothetical protein
MIFMNEHGISELSVNYCPLSCLKLMKLVGRQAKIASLLSCFLEPEEAKATKTPTVTW